MTTGFDVSRLQRWTALPLRLIVGYGFIAHGYAKLMNGPDHLPYGFSSIKLRAVTAAGPQFGPSGYETNLVYIAALALGGSGSFALDAWLPSLRRDGRTRHR